MICSMEMTTDYQSTATKVQVTDILSGGDFTYGCQYNPPTVNTKPVTMCNLTAIPLEIMTQVAEGYEVEKKITDAANEALSNVGLDVDEDLPEHWLLMHC